MPRDWPRPGAPSTSTTAAQRPGTAGELSDLRAGRGVSPELGPAQPAARSPSVTNETRRGLGLQ